MLPINHSERYITSTVINCVKCIHMLQLIHILKYYKISSESNQGKMRHQSDKTKNKASISRVDIFLKNRVDFSRSVIQTFENDAGIHMLQLRPCSD